MHLACTWIKFFYRIQEAFGLDRKHLNKGYKHSISFDQNSQSFQPFNNDCFLKFCYTYRE